MSAGPPSYEFRSNGQGSHIGRMETETGIGGKFGVWLGISAKDFGDIEDSAVGRMQGTGYPEQDLDFRFDRAVTPESTLTFAHQYVNQDDISRWHRTAQQSRLGTWRTRRRARRMDCQQLRSGTLAHLPPLRRRESAGRCVHPALERHRFLSDLGRFGNPEPRHPAEDSHPQVPTSIWKPPASI